MPSFMAEVTIEIAIDAKDQKEAQDRVDSMADTELREAIVGYDKVKVLGPYEEH